MSDDFNNRASDHFIFTLKNFLNSLSYPKGKISSDNSLKTNLAEFQRYKQLSVKDGSLNAETFRALGEELTPVQIEMLVLHHPELKHLFIGRPRDGFLYRPALQPKTVTLDLRIVFDKNQYSNDNGPKIHLRETIQDAIDTFKAIKVEFKIAFAPGVAKFSNEQQGSRPYEIIEGGINGQINVFLHDSTQYISRPESYYRPETRQIFMLKIAEASFRKGKLAHELGHLLIHFATGKDARTSYGLNTSWRRGIVWADTGNFNQDEMMDDANEFMIGKNLEYGTYWVDDYRTVTETSYEPLTIYGADKAGLVKEVRKQRNPTVFDLYRLGARNVAAQNK